MKIFNKFFVRKEENVKEIHKSNVVEEEVDEISDNKQSKNIVGVGISVGITPENEISINSLPIGMPTGGKTNDYYVYEWFIKETGEVFYVGKGRGNRYKEFHQRAYAAEKIREMYETDSRFVDTGLTEMEAIELESQEMTRILNETSDRLTNRITPFLTNRDNGYGPSPSTPEIQLEVAPVLYANEIDEHYFNVKHRPFDKVEYKKLKSVSFITTGIRDEITIIYGGQVEKYKDEVMNTLKANGNKILKSKMAKSITAWIYIGTDDVNNYLIDQKKAHEKLGREIPVYHLIDVWKFLKAEINDIASSNSEAELAINPFHDRVPLQDIKNLHDWSKGFKEGFSYYERGDVERKAGNIDKAIELYDAARYHGYNAPALYNAYAMAYRKVKDYENEITILDEAIERVKAEKSDNEVLVMKYNDRRAKAIELLKKQKLK